EGAKFLSNAISDKSPILVVGNNELLRFVVAELLIKAFPEAKITECTVEQSHLHLYRENNGDDDTNPVDLPALCVVLDHVAFDELNLNSHPLLQIIYVGNVLPESLRIGEQNENLVLLNPFDVLREERGSETSITALVFKLCQAA